MKIAHQVKQSLFLNMLLTGPILFSHTILANTSELDDSNAIIFIPPVAGKPPIIQGEASDKKLPPSIVFQNEHEALDTDASTLAKELGLPTKDIKDAVVFQNAFYQYATRLRTRYPDRVSGVWVEAAPATIGRIRFIGEVPPEVSAEVEKRGQI